jgi:hypothetical protein
MHQKRKVNILTRFTALALVCSALFQCTEDELVTPDPTVENDQTTSATATTDCGCTYTVPSNTYAVDGTALAIKPGAVICLKYGNTYGNIVFRNLKGTATSPITIRNCGGTVTLNATGRPFGLKTEMSQYIRITGGTGTTYGIKVNGGTQGVQLEKLTTQVEVDHLEIASSGFAGVMAKTDPTCDNATVRGNFVMKNVLLHDNYVHDTGGEGFYVGNTFYLNGMNTPCGVRLPHIIEGLKIYNNVVKNSGWEAIQVGSCPSGAEVYNNRIENYGVRNVQYQNNGVQFGEGAPGKFYNNYIKSGKGIALFILSNASNYVYNNVIVNAGQDGIFVDERTATGPGFKFINNTIINPGTNGMRLYSDLVTMNNVLNNIIVNPGSYSKYTYPRTGNDAYVYLLSKTVKVQLANNHFTRDIATLKFRNAGAYDYALTSTSPVINKGYNISTYNITVDYAQQPRLKGTAYDIGAYEY